MKQPASYRQTTGIGSSAQPELHLRKVGVSRFDLRDPYHMAVTLTWAEFFGAMLAAELAINATFAVLYALAPGSIATARPGSLTDAFFFSIETLATVGYGVMAPATLYGHIVSSIEILCGMTLTAVFTGLIFVRFSRPRAKILFAEKPVVTNYDGRPALMLRIGNGRLTLLGDAHAVMTALVQDRTSEGTRIRRVQDMRLIRARFPIFMLTWTLVHEIDPDSPLHGATPERLAEMDFLMVVTVEGRDHAIANQVHEIRTYTAADVAFGMRYVDAVSRDGLETTADMTKISLIEPDGQP